MSAFQEVVAELKTHAPALGAWMYIAMYGFADMVKRMKDNPDNPRFSEILFPHSKITLFTEEQALNLETVWRSLPFFQKGLQGTQSGGSQDPEPTVFELFDSYTASKAHKIKEGQVGGNLASFKKFAGKVGPVVGSVLGNVNPDLFSPDIQYQSFWDTLDSLDTEITNFSKQYGLMAMESTASDVRFTIPPGIPIIIPIKMILPSINIILEILRYLGPKVPFLGSFTKMPVSILLALLDLARGNLYHSIFSFMGIFGRSPMIAGMALKIVRDGFMLISPNLRDELRSVLYKSSKSFFVGFIFWLFTTVSPELIRKPIVKLLDKLTSLAEKYNDTVGKLSDKATTALRGVARVEFPQVPTERIPSFSDLYVLQEYIQNPQFYCYPEVDALIQEMRSIPPLALFFDIMNIPLKRSVEWQEVCAKVQSTPLIDYVKPTIQLLNPSPLPLPLPLPLPSASKIGSENAQDPTANS